MFVEGQLSRKMVEKVQNIGLFSTPKSTNKTVVVSITDSQVIQCDINEISLNLIV